MRVLIAPDKFAGTLTAVQAAHAIARGWRRRSPADELDLAPMADGGPGFVEVMHAALGGEMVLTTVLGPYGDPVPGVVLMVEDGHTAYVESAQACGAHLDPAERRDPERASSYGVGQLVAVGLSRGASRIIVGLGGSGTNDGGAGLLAALGARADVELNGGPLGLAEITEIDLDAPRQALAGVELVVASDVDNPLLGLIGCTNVYGPQKGLSADRLHAVDGLLETYATVCDKRLARAQGAGAAGGLGYALMLLGAERHAGISLVVEAVGLERRAREADLVITGEGSFDFSSRSGKVPYGVAGVATGAVRPCIALAGSVLVGSREMRALGVESAYAMVDLVGESAAFADPAGSLARLAERVARTWSPPVRPAPRRPGD